MTAKIPHAELSRHSTRLDLWLAINGVVYDLTEFAPVHPGGLEFLLRYAGQDATAAYNEVHSPDLIQNALPLFDQIKRIGLLDKSSPPTTSPHPPVTAPPKPPLSSLISTYDFMQVAHAAFPPKTDAFVFSAATDLITHNANTSTYDLITLRPRVLRGVAAPISLATTLLSSPTKTPLFCAPTSLGKTVHPQGECELARGCRAAGVAQVVSTSASFTLREIFAATSPSSTSTSSPPSPTHTHPIFFQLYVDKVRSRSEALLRDAVALGIKGVFLTVDAPVAGKREADERVSVSGSSTIFTPMSGGVKAADDSSGGGLGRLVGGYVDASLCWDDIPWLRGCLPKGMPIVIKGVQTAMDAMRAMEAGCQGVVVSNHGGRSLDTATPTVLVLLELQRCCPEVFEGMEVFIDGGVMRGTDVFKALCLGAKGVGIGRGVLYALGGYGAEGVRRYFESECPGSFFWSPVLSCVGRVANEDVVLNDELQTTMKMCGITSLDHVHPGLLSTRAVDHLVPSELSEEHPYLTWRPKKSKLAKL